MDTLLIHLLNSLLYASVLFLIAGGLSLIYGVMRIVNLAHGNLYAFGAYVTAWVIGRIIGSGPCEASVALYALLPVGAVAAGALGAIIEPTLLRPLYKRAEEYQLLITFGLLLILEDLMRLIWGPYPLSVSALYEALGSLHFGEEIYPTYNLVVIVVGAAAAAGIWAFVYRTHFGVVLRATSQNMRMASALGVNVNRVYVQAFSLGCFMAGLGGAVVVPQQGAVLGMGVDALILAFVVVVIGGLGSLEGALVGAVLVGHRARDRHQSLSGDRAGRALPDGGRRAPHPPRRALRPRMSAVAVAPPRPELGRARRHRARDPAVRGAAVPDGAAVVRADLRHRRARLQPAPRLHGTPLLRALRLLRGGGLRGGLRRQVPQDRLDGGAPPRAGSSASALVAALFGLLCVRYTKIFFGILTLALSQVLWSLAFKFFWVTGGSDGLRVPTPTLLAGTVKIGATAGQDKLDFLSHRYYFYVLAIFVICVALMWVIVHSPFGKALQAVRDNETRAEFVGVQVWHYRWVAFLISGIYTGLAGALWVPLNGLTTPDILHWTFSGKIVFFTVLGGFQTFFGPIVGAVIYNYLETYAVGHTVYWQMVLGIVLVVLVLALPSGIVGTVIRLVPRFRKADAT